MSEELRAESGQGQRPFAPRIGLKMEVTLQPVRYQPVKMAVEYAANVDEVLDAERNRDIRAAMREMIRMAVDDLAGQLGVKPEELFSPERGGESARKED